MDIPLEQNHIGIRHGFEGYKRKSSTFNQKADVVGLSAFFSKSWLLMPIFPHIYKKAKFMSTSSIKRCESEHCCSNSENQQSRKFFRVFICCICLLSILCSSCNSSKNKIDEKYRSGVVLILNQYYYTLTLPNGKAFYLAGDSDGNIINFEADPDSAVNCMVAATGTGFFISDDGKIATNKHVASRTVSDKDAVRVTKQILNKLERFLDSQNDSCESIKELCQVQYSRSTDANERAKIVQVFNYMEEKIKKNNEIIRELKYIDPADADFEYHSTLKVAYNGTFVKSVDDMYPCTLRDTASQDLAVIQLNSKQTPPDKYVFPVPEKNMLEHYSFGEYLSRLLGSDKNEQLFMIGFNRGFSMAVTEEGIYSQCTEGSINQTQKEIIQYNINTEPGSSGSPVLNRRGQLVAINFAGYRNAQSFNYGVKEKHLYDLLKNDH